MSDEMNRLEFSSSMYFRPSCRERLSSRSTRPCFEVTLMQCCMLSRHFCRFAFSTASRAYLFSCKETSALIGAKSTVEAHLPATPCECISIALRRISAASPCFAAVPSAAPSAISEMGHSSSHFVTLQFNACYKNNCVCMQETVGRMSCFHNMR